MAKYWMGSEAVACDLCGSAFVNRMIDGKTTAGPWGLLCPSCHRKHGIGLGTGRGQEYERQADNRWLKIGG